mgnify:CR=1 FL=1
MIYVVHVNGQSNPVGISSSIKEAVALAHCSLGRSQYVKTDDFNKDISTIRKILKESTEYSNNDYSLLAFQSDNAKNSLKTKWGIEMKTSENSEAEGK